MEVWWWKIKRNLPLYTYPAVAGYLQRGNVGTEKRRKPHPLHILRSCKAHTPLCLATFRGEYNDGKVRGTLAEVRRSFRRSSEELGRRSVIGNLKIILYIEVRKM